MQTRYEIIIFYFGGGHARACYCGRTAWALKTARKHKNHIVNTMVLTGIYKNAILAPAGEYFT